MSDPFTPQERSRGVTRRTLEILADHQYPTVISTKGVLFACADYLPSLVRGNFFIQVSFSTYDAGLAMELERGTPSPAERLAALATATDAGVRASIRHQPVLPSREAEMFELIGAAKDVGASHYSAEFLKLALEHNERETTTLRRLNGSKELYQEHGSRVGREWILPASYRLPWVLEAREATRAAGMTFGAADTDLLPMSDGQICCSGADVHMPDAGNPFHHTYLHAVQANTDGLVRYASIRDEWRPGRSIARFINSRSRIRGTEGAGIERYVRRNWEGRSNGPSPVMFHGVHQTQMADHDGTSVYEVEPWLRNLINDRVGAVPRTAHQ